MVGLAQFPPMVLLNLAVGHVADRYDRRKIYITTQVLAGAEAALLAGLPQSPAGYNPISDLDAARLTFTSALESPHAVNNRVTASVDANGKTSKEITLEESVFAVEVKPHHSEARVKIVRPTM